MSNDSGTMEANCLAGMQPPALEAAECEVAISCYNTVPPCLEAELERLYHHIHSSLCHYAVARRAQDAQAYVARRGNRPLAIFLFQRDAHSVVVFNEMMQLAPEEIERFANYIFSRFPAITRISFSKIGKDIGALSLPAQQYGTSEDIVVSLPATPEAYFSRLGAKMRHNIRRQLKAIAADFPGFSFHTHENGAIAGHHVASLVHLKKAGMDEKRIQFGITPEESAWMIERAKTNGLLIVALFEGKVCGGSLSFRLGDHYFAHVNGYDARFAKYSLGMLCCYLATEEQIRRGAKEAHLSRGRNQYKFKLLGVQRDMANLDIYRSRMTYYRCAGRILGNALDDFIERQKLMLLENEHRSGFMPSLVGRVVKTVRSIKRSSFRPTS
ncbi:GNAT family N-acetyltransferase [Massilia forsythiae]|uniref:GNAT family N-acetyltransferase n=1 Tax=Massilia forsythiae TaxID=2728020 RepID=A0A7Z2VVN0_9BURK|nr:GNAT family N-acetyltransferase [Massilia forsythiae]QJE00019.1 GNAT family N-acetyltransferase [Massilia forsythiae]